jgi:WD40 repeat protein
MHGNCELKPYVVYSGSEDNTIREWQLVHHNCTRVFRGHSGAVTYVVADASVNKLFSASYDGTIAVWDISDSSLGEVNRKKASHLHHEDVASTSNNRLRQHRQHLAAQGVPLLQRPLTKTKPCTSHTDVIYDILVSAGKPAMHSFSAPRTNGGVWNATGGSATGKYVYSASGDNRWIKNVPVRRRAGICYPMAAPCFAVFCLIVCLLVRLFF